MRFSICLTVLLLMCSGNPVFGSEVVKGTFEAIRACDALQSKNTGSNPGALRVQAGVTYEAVEVNKKTDWTWVRVLMPDTQVSEPRRWVPKECGVVDIAFSTPGDPSSGGTGNDCSTPNTFDSHVMALSWQPGFCEHNPSGPSKPECDALNNGDIVIHHLTIHGLWPNKKECGHDYGSCRDVPMDLEEETVIALAPFMPNFIFQESLGRHEWLKHGTCRLEDDDDYFRLSLKIRAIVDASSIGEFIKNNVGQEISTDDYRDFIVQHVGTDVADKVSLHCAGGSQLQEIRVNLPQEIDANGDIGSLVVGAPDAGRFQGNCGSTIQIEDPGI